MFRDLFQTMKAPECVMAVDEAYGVKGYVKLPDALHDREVRLKNTEPGFFRFYQFHFIEGTPFTQDDFDNERRVAVITKEISDLLFGKDAKALGQTVRFNNLDFRICGVVETPSALTEVCLADIYLYLSADGMMKEWLSLNAWRSVPLHLYFSVPADRLDAFMQELKSVEARYNATHKDDPADVLTPLVSYYSEVWSEFSHMFYASVNDNRLWFLTPAAILLLLLFVPAVNLSGMVASRMERRLPEMAIRKAFGAKRRTLLGQVIMENLVLTLIGAFAGLCLAWTALYAWRDWVFYVFSDNTTTFGRVPIIEGALLFGPAIFLIALLFCSLLNVLAATLPAWLSLRKPIVVSMMIKK
jgi:putative ABC transport system permease protein